MTCRVRCLVGGWCAQLRSSRFSTLLGRHDLLSSRRDSTFLCSALYFSPLCSVLFTSLLCTFLFSARTPRFALYFFLLCSALFTALLCTFHYSVLYFSLLCSDATICSLLLYALLCTILYSTTDATICSALFSAMLSTILYSARMPWFNLYFSLLCLVLFTALHFSMLGSGALLCSVLFSILLGRHDLLSTFLCSALYFSLLCTFHCSVLFYALLWRSALLCTFHCSALYYSLLCSVATLVSLLLSALLSTLRPTFHWPALYFSLLCSGALSLLQLRVNFIFLYKSHASTALHFICDLCSMLDCVLRQYYALALCTQKATIICCAQTWECEYVHGCNQVSIKRNINLYFALCTPPPLLPFLYSTIRRCALRGGSHI